VATQTGGVATTRAELEAVLGGENTPLARLRLVMDAWCAMWFWPLEPAGGVAPPTTSEWLSALEGLLGVDPADTGDSQPAQIDLFADLDALEAREAELASGLFMPTVAQVRGQHPWLEVVREIADREGFFHWELQFAPVFRRGGFDLQVGNPPWVRPRWLDDVVLAELEPWFGLAGTTHRDFQDRRSVVLGDRGRSERYGRELVAAAGANAMMSAATLRPALKGAPLNLYIVFLLTTWSHMREGGAVGLLHPPGLFFDSNTTLLRRAAYPRLRRSWHFVNQAGLFEEVGGPMAFGVHIYGGARSVGFPLITGAQLPATVDESITHDGSGQVPGIKTPEGQWDRRPHRDRIVWVDEDVLTKFASLYDDPRTPAHEARLVRPYTQFDVDVLASIGQTAMRVEDRSYQWTRGWEEDRAKVDGLILWDTKYSTGWSEVVYQGPHFTPCNPFAKQPNEECRSKGDWSRHDLEILSSVSIPRTNYQRACPEPRYRQEAPAWGGSPATERYRIIYRRMAAAETERSLQSALIPPGPLHVNTCHSMAFSSLYETVLTVGMWSSIPLDFVFKASGRSDVRDDIVRRFPFPHPSVFDRSLLLRTLRLNCLTEAYRDAWDALVEYIPEGLDEWALADRRLASLCLRSLAWTPDVPLRSAFERRQALVEVDALAALCLGMSVDHLVVVYRSTFGRLRQFEHVMRHDQNGREVPKEVWTAYEQDPEGADLGRYVPPFTKPDREAEMRQAYAVFAQRYGGGVA
jgi:hypothetical protein